jgi:hypothetical protein
MGDGRKEIPWDALPPPEVPRGQPPAPVVQATQPAPRRRDSVVIDFAAGSIRVALFLGAALTVIALIRWAWGR